MSSYPTMMPWWVHPKFPWARNKYRVFPQWMSSRPGRYLLWNYWSGPPGGLLCCGVALSVVHQPVVARTTMLQGFDVSKSWVIWLLWEKGVEVLNFVLSQRGISENCLLTVLEKTMYVANERGITLVLVAFRCIQISCCGVVMAG
jgi:hypothetical protein